MTSHFWLMVFFSACVSIVFGALMRDETTEQVRFALLVFVGFVVTGVVLSWLMFPFPV